VIGFALRRSLQSLISIAILMVAVFVMARLSGDPVDLYLPDQATEAARDALRAEWKLDRPIPEQFVGFLGDVSRLDFGESLSRGGSALGLVLQRVPYTMALAAITFALALSLAIVVGLYAATRPGSLVDRFANLLSFVTVALPEFWTGLILILVFAVSLGWLPTSGGGGLQYLVLPVATLMLKPFGALVQMMRASVGEQLTSQYVTTAIARGLTLNRIVYRHVLRNSLAPVLTVAGDSLIQLLNGAVIVEVVFGWPGIGLLTIDAIGSRDFAVIQATVFVVACMVFTVNFLLDIAYAALDPRLRFGGI
jgi:peptide/nickel transport system permease protein